MLRTYSFDPVDLLSLKESFEKRLTSIGYHIPYVDVWTYELPYSLESNDESFHWHVDYGKGLLAVWASVFNSELRNRRTKKQIWCPERSLIVFSDAEYEHRVPRAVETGQGRRWFARAYPNGL